MVWWHHHKSVTSPTMFPFVNNSVNPSLLNPVTSFLNDSLLFINTFKKFNNSQTSYCIKTRYTYSVHSRNKPPSKYKPLKYRTPTCKCKCSPKRKLMSYELICLSYDINKREIYGRFAFAKDMSVEFQCGWGCRLEDCFNWLKFSKPSKVLSRWH